MNDAECPYCGAGVEINHDDGRGYAEDKCHEQECWKCEKTFVFTAAIHFTYTAAKADCLNGGEHRYELTKTYPPEAARLRCRDCDKETRP